MTIYEALRKDHQVVRDLLNELTMCDENDPRASELIDEIRDELIPHARAEETVLYNSIRSIESAESIVDNSFSEHMSAEALLRTLQVKDKVGMDWHGTVVKLRDALEEHIADEEGRIFMAAQQLFTDEEAEDMGNVFEELKPQVREEGFMKTTIDLIANAMPPRFAESFRSFGNRPGH